MPLIDGADVPELWLPNSAMRERANVRSVDPEGLKWVTGYMVPRYTDNMPDGRRVMELKASDLSRVEDGYGCGECLATFNRRFPDCPGCGHQLDPNRDIVEWAPDYWKPSPATVTNNSESF